MSKAFRYFFCKKDRRDGENIHHYNKENKRGIIRVEARREEAAKKYEERKYSPLRRRTSDSLSRDPVYLNRLFGISNEGTLRLLHTPSEEEPQQNTREKQVSSSANRNNQNNMQVYTTTVTRNSTSLNPPSSSRPSEPFPYKVYDSAPRRSTLYYGVDYQGKPLNSEENPRPPIKKGDGGNTGPNTSQSEFLNHPHLINVQDDQERSVQPKRRVTLVTPNEMGDIPLMNDYENETNDSVTEPTRKTVLRFRPHSSASRNSNTRESVKLMVFRTDEIEHPPMVLSKHVRQLPLKRINPTPVLITDDGRVLKPLDTEKRAKNSLSVNKEASRVRLSMADIEKICKVQRQSTDTMNPVFNSRKSMNRNSIRQSLISRQMVNEKRSSILREHSEKPSMSYQCNVEENQPDVFGVPVPIIPSRNRSNSRLSKESVASYDLNKYQTLNNEDTNYYVEESKPINKKLLYSRGPYQVDSTIIKKDKPIVVYEVHNLENNNHSISKNSMVTNENTKNTYTKPQRNSTQKSVVTNQLINPQVEVIYQEPKTQPTKKIKEKQSIRNKVTIQKSYENYTHDSSPINEQQPAVVYVAEVPSGLYPTPKLETRKCPLKNKRSRTSCSNKEIFQSKDFCGLTCESQEKSEPLKNPRNSYLKMVSSSQQTDFENDVDFLCYPAEKLSKAQTSFPESDSKLKWKIIIKKQENK